MTTPRNRPNLPSRVRKPFFLATIPAKDSLAVAGTKRVSRASIPFWPASVAGGIVTLNSFKPYFLLRNDDIIWSNLAQQLILEKAA